MTLHLAMSSDAGTVMVSDSQSSTETAEVHGAQKQYVGDDFLVGGGGPAAILQALFLALRARGVRAAAVHGFVEGFFAERVCPAAAEQVELLVIADATEGETLRRFRPGMLRRFEESTRLGAIGSGAEFVWRAWRRDGEIGVH